MEATRRHCAGSRAGYTNWRKFGWAQSIQPVYTTKLISLITFFKRLIDENVGVQRGKGLVFSKQYDIGEVQESG